MTQTQVHLNSTNPIVSQYEIHIVLVRTLYSLNIGSTSRAMSNMGAHQLHLIKPQCEITFEAQQMAANGQEGLINRKVYPSWDDFLKQNPEGIRIALSARDGRARGLRDFKDSLNSLKSLPDIKRSKLTKLYLFFGPEDCGLTGAEIDCAHFTCSLPTYGSNWSLNLAQATLLSLFIVRDTWGGTRTTLEGQTPPPILTPQSKDSNYSLPKSHEFSSESNSNQMKPHLTKLSPEKSLYDWIEILGFDLTKRRVNAYTVMKRILLHNVPTSKELRIFEVVVQQTIRKLKEHQYYQKNLSKRPLSNDS